VRALSPFLLATISIVPLVAGLAGAVASGWDASAWTALMNTPGLWRSVALSLWTGGAATAISLGLAHIAVALAGTSGWGGRLRGVCLPVLASPHLALGIGLVLLASPSGLLMRFVSPWATGFERPPDWTIVQDPHGLALIGGLVIKEVPFLIVLLMGALSQVNAGPLMQQAQSLGYGRLKAWLIAVAPLLQRQVRFGVAAVLVFGVTNVEMALPLGPTSPPPLAIRLLEWFTAADLAHRPQAFAGAWLLLTVTMAGLGGAYGAAYILGGMWRRSAFSGARWLRDDWVSRVTGTLILTTLLGGLLAIFALLLRTSGGAWRFPHLLPSRMSLEAWRNVAPDLGASVATTLLLGLATAGISVVITLFAAEALHHLKRARRRLGALLFIPLLLPQMAFLFGWQVVLVSLRLDGTLVAVCWSHTLFALPYVWATLAEQRAALHPGYQITAKLLGASDLRVWWTVTAPLLLRSILLALALAFSVSVAVYLPTLFAGGGRVATLATEAAASMSAGNIQSAAANGAAQALLPLLAFAGSLGAAHLLFRNRRGVPR